MTAHWHRWVKRWTSKLCAERWQSWNRAGPRERSWDAQTKATRSFVGTAIGIEFARSFRSRTRDKQWQRDAFTTFVGVPWNPRGLAVEAPVASSRKKYITKSLVQQHGETPGCSACLRVSSQHMATCRDRFERLINPNATDVIPVIPSVVGDPGPTVDVSSTGQRHATQPGTLKRQAVGMKRGAEDNPTSSSAKRAHTPPSSVGPDPATARR